MKTTPLTMRVEAKGTNAKLSHSAADFLTNAVPNEPVDGHSIQFYFTTLLARECQATLNVSTAPDTVTLTVAPDAADRETSRLQNIPLTARLPCERAVGRSAASEVLA